MVQVPNAVNETAPEAVAEVAETKTQRKARLKAEKAAATPATEGEVAAPTDTTEEVTSTEPVAPKEPKEPKVKGPNDLTPVEARALAILAGGQGYTNGDFYGCVNADTLGAPTKDKAANGLMTRGFVEVKVVEPQEGQGGRTRSCFFITDAGRAALALQPDVATLTEAAMTALSVARDKQLAKKAEKAAAKAAAAPATTTVPTEPVA